MSEQNFFKDISQSVRVPADIIKAVVEPPAHQLGQSISDLVYIAFSSISKKRAKIEQDIENFKAEIALEISKIDPDKKVEPKLSIVGPAIEASKFYIEEDSIRLMFAKLIAASVNNEYKNLTIPAFVEIIKQLSPLDAQNFSYLYNNRDNRLPVGRIVFKREKDSIVFCENFFPFSGINIDNLNDYSVSLDNLLRLRLINIEHGEFFTEYGLYKNFENHSILKELIPRLNKLNSSLSMISRDPLEEDDFNKKPELYRLEIEKSTWDITNFGKSFALCCL